MPKARRIAVSSRVCAAKRASELDDDQEHPAEPGQRRGDLVGEAGRQVRIVLGGADQLQRQHADTGAAAGDCGSCGRGSQVGPPARGCRADRRVPRARRCGRPRAAMRLPERAADFGDQPLGFLARVRVELVGQHGAAALDRPGSPCRARRGRRGAHQRPPGAFVRAVDLQQLLRRRDRRLRLGLLAQQRLGHACGPRSRSRSRSLVSQASKVGIDAVQVLQQLAVQQRQRGRLRRRSPASPPPRRSRPCRDASDRWSRVTVRISVPTGDNASSSRWISCRSDARACSSGRRLHSSSASRPRSAGARRRQRQHGQQRAGLAPGRQHAFAGERPGFHLADQPQPDRRTCAGRRRRRHVSRGSVLTSCAIQRRSLRASQCDVFDSLVLLRF